MQFWLTSPFPTATSSPAVISFDIGRAKAKGRLMSTYVLVHGAWGGSWCWDRVVAQLHDAGQNAIVLDLPGRAGDLRPHRQISLADYVQKVLRVISLQSEPVILVGHSMGGMIISQSAEAAPDRIRTLVYVTAFMANTGQSLLELAGMDPASLVGPYLVLDEQSGSAHLKPEAPLKEILLGSCSDLEVARAQAMCVPEPLAPFTTPIRISAERYGRVPRVFIKCQQDRAISASLQQRMIEAEGCQQTITLQADHSPFWSDPATLSRHLAGLS
jgi:pimeloyl-ACP methyl ester carboxylesterase